MGPSISGSITAPVVRFDNTDVTISGDYDVNDLTEIRGDTGPAVLFADVPTDYWAAAWIEAPKPVELLVAVQ